MQRLIHISILLFFFAQLSMAQEPTKRERVTFQQGDLVVSTTGRAADGNLTRTDQAYSDFVIGVYNEKTGTSNVPQIIQSGIAYVKFDPSNGHVAKGDYIASSSNSGHGMKATQSGVVVGVALEDSRSIKGLLMIRVQPDWVKQ